LKLVIEVDGGIHLTDQAQEHDDGRSGELEKLGIRIIRFTNDQVIKDQEFVLNKIHKYMTETASPALPGAGDGRG
jgi:very-short-patch-repair endonuclease